MNAGFGVHFVLGTPGSFIFFKDSAPAPTDAGSLCHPALPAGKDAPDAVPGNCVYGGAAELVKTYTLGNGMTFTNLCAYTAAGVASCGLSQLTITFARPNTKAFIGINNTYPTGANLLTSACIALTSPQGGERYVHIAQTGEIHVNTTVCPT